MTPDEIDKLTLDELRVECARAMGWKDDGDFLVTPDGWRIAKRSNLPVPAAKNLTPFEYPDYPRSIAAAFELQTDIERRGLKEQYMRALEATLQIASGVTYYVVALWDVATATPEQRSRAYLKAVQNA